jgi:hypothetical protein
MLSTIYNILLIRLPTGCPKRWDRTTDPAAKDQAVVEAQAELACMRAVVAAEQATLGSTRQPLKDAQRALPAVHHSATLRLRALALYRPMVKKIALPLPRGARLLRRRVRRRTGYN